ncbi:hypothetical protein H257_18696 [Aphanomyces astaci]|uniref:Uncharacterized protein n=1 Tax=Aphanomyces astaci TaxID=112090 RepID=W4FBV3_APHAT|nr:hypothetical protein H257_18696 [Aphanomyces astaci]ETV64399.1 hypothetical protein H257_18696 [Aphanomyces astaci]|eukprot:XP_009846115.1 hypothetical protein H257_18696 [Aphanomyces astaci]
MQQPPPDQSPTSTPTWTQLSQMYPPRTAARGLTMPSDGHLHTIPVARTKASILIPKPTKVVTQDQSASYSLATCLAMPLHSPNGRDLYRATLYCNWNTPADKSNKSVSTYRRRMESSSEVATEAKIHM